MSERDWAFRAGQWVTVAYPFGQASKRGEVVRASARKAWVIVDGEGMMEFQNAHGGRLWGSSRDRNFYEGPSLRSRER